MNMNRIKVGPITMALGLIVTGVVLLVGNFVNPELLVDAWKLWPLLLVGLGLEFIIRDAQSKRSTESTEVRFSWASLLIIGLIVISGFTAHVTYKIVGAVNFEQILKEQVFNNVATYTRPFEKEPVPIANKSVKITLENSTGDIDVKLSSDDQLRVKGEIIANGPDQKEAKQKTDSVNVNIEGTENILIKADQADYNGANKLKINYEVFIPKGISVEINNKVGEISVEEISGQLKVYNKVGGIRVTDINSTAELTSDVGEIDVDGITGNVVIKSKTGSVRVDNPESNVKATAQTGSLELTAEKVLEGNYELEAKNGSIDVIIPKESNLKVYATTDHGSVNGPDSVATVQQDKTGSKLEGNLGSGKGILRASSRTGSINLRLK